MSEYTREDAAALIAQWPLPAARPDASDWASPYLGVSRVDSRWLAKIQVNGVNRRLGRFDDDREAAIAREEVARELGVSRCPILLEDHVAIPLTKGYRALVDFADLPTVIPFTWSVATPGNLRYAVHHHQFMHRMLLGVDGSAMWGEHRNCDGLDNRRANLRMATRTQNNRNRRANGRSQYIGVSAIQSHGKFAGWRACAKREGKTRYLGTFATEIEAAKAYDAAVFARDPEFSRLNFPEDYPR